MSAAVTSGNKRLIRELLKVGRWNNESEIVRYGLHLVAQEVDTQQRRSLEAFPAGILRKAYRQLQAQDLAEDAALSSASARPGRGELDA